MQNKQNARLKGSPPFNQRPQLNGGGIFLFSPEANDRIARFFPLDTIKVANKSNADVEVKLDTNDDRGLFVESGTQEIFDQVQPFRSYKIQNLSNNTTIAKDELKITVRKAPLDADDAARRQAANESEGPDISDMLGIANMLQ